MSKNPQSPRPLSLHGHRLDNNSSKLPRIRDTPQLNTQLRSTPLESADSSITSNKGTNGIQHAQSASTGDANNLKLKSSSFDINFTGSQSTIAAPFSPSPTSQNKKEPFRSRILNSFGGAGGGRTNSASSRRTLSYPTPSAATTPTRTKILETTPRIVASDKKARNVLVSNSKNGLNDKVAKETPSTMLSQGSYVSQTKNWIADQSHLDGTPSPSVSQMPQSALENTPSRSTIAPIRGIKNNRRMESTASSRESALMTLEGHNSQRESQDDQHSDDSDLFLKVAREEDMDQQKKQPALGRLDTRKSRISMRQSLPAPSPNFRSSMYLRRGSEQEAKLPSRSTEEGGGLSQVLEYKPSIREGSSSSSSTPSNKRTRNAAFASLSNPTTPSASNHQENAPEPQLPYSGRRPSVQDRTTTYRQSNLSNSYSVPRTTAYHSSPLVSRPMDMNEEPETQRTTEGTESTVSTTAPSTVWDELEDLKSRIHRLELTGKLPTTSGAAVSRATHERPPTATTTETTMSTSPKRGRGNSISPADAHVDPTKTENHPLLRSALAKSKPLLDPEVYNTLEATATDALAIASMMGISGQPGPISSSQSIVSGAHSMVSDRQVRRKADSLCRSLTELCLALSERRLDESDPTLTQNGLRPNSHGRDADVLQSIEPISPRQSTSSDIVKIKASPRSFSRLEARRSSLLASTALPTLRFPPSESSTPTQGLSGGRRTSLFLRGRRAETEDPQESEEARFRAPSRAKTELGRRHVGREETSHPPLPENVPRSPTTSSSLALRRSYTTSLAANAGPQSSPLQASSGRRYYERTPEREVVVNSNIGGRRYLERTPERDTNTIAGRLAEERGQRKVSAGYTFASRSRAGSLRKESLGASQNGAY